MSDTRCTWFLVNETFDSTNGGAMYVRTSPDGTRYQAAGALWLDTVGRDQLPYYAFVAEFTRGDDIDGLAVSEAWDAASAFNYATNPYVCSEIGSFATIGEAMQAVEDAVSTYLA